VTDVKTKRLVRVDVDRRGGWQVRVPGRRPVRFATREEAERAALEGCSGDERASQILVRDAYGRVMHRRGLGRPAAN
jgi:hypothetical protein